ncbi:flavodoxin [uncultured Ruthenibacterium sp.]|uniref:flavodoxin n=1 Tax=uncultured Ruthenibacterium sp. TaxID=1905347 RepID=UPI00349EDB50
MKTAVIYWSGTGNTEAMARALAEGAGADLFLVSEMGPDQAAGYDRLALGCPAMGDEVLEETEFEPFFAQLEPQLAGKVLALFGSYGWGDGAWMRDWADRARAAGAVLCADPLTVANAPDEQDLDACRELGRTLAQ